jgi:HlyD family secretion protein
MKKSRSIFALSIPLLVVLIATGWMLKNENENPETYLVGTFEAPTVNISSEIPGRIDTLFVELGDTVEKGELLATLEANIMDAKLAQAQGVKEATESLVMKVKKGARKELINAARNQYMMAKSQFAFADKTYKRFQVLFADSIISKQEMDEVEFKHTAAKNQMEAALANYRMAQNGATDEDLEIVKAKLEAAKGVYNEAQAYYKQLKIYAPVSGEISEKIGEEGEVMKAGYPIMTVMRPEKVYAVINVREDQLSKCSKGTTLQGTIPGLGGKSYRFRVYYLAPMADFATWVPTKAKGEYDLKTFEVRLKPVTPIKGLRPGMTVQVRLS